MYPQIKEKSYLMSLKLKLKKNVNLRSLFQSYIKETNLIKMKNR